MVGGGFLVDVGNLLFNPLLSIEPVYAVSIIAMFLSLIFVIANKVLVNQEKLRHVKKEMKNMQVKIKKARAKNNEKELKVLWEKSMKVNHEQLKMVLKPMVISMLFIFILFPWLRFTYGDVVSPVNDSSVVFVQGDFEKVFMIDVFDDGSIKLRDEVSGKSYVVGDKVRVSNIDWMIKYESRTVDDKDKSYVVFKSLEVKLPFKLPLVGGYVGWLGLYILASIPATMIFRKLFGVQ